MSLKSLFSTFISNVREWIGLAPAQAVPAKASVAAAQMVQASMPQPRFREANANADIRRRLGIPHGTPGAKLARKAMSGKVGVAVIR